MRITMTLFRAYDIRGVYPSDINEELAEKIGKAFGTIMPENARVAVGGDVRESTPALKKKLIEGLLSTGASVLDIGMAPTPTLYFAVASLGLEGGMIVTASHNPRQYNGMKIVGAGGVCLSWDTGIKQMKELVESGDFRTGQGQLEERDMGEAYLSHILSKVNVQKKLKVVVDPANGACSFLGPEAFKRLGWDVIPLFCEPDGTFPNHEADPIKKKNLAALQEKVKETNADLGVAYDADGDRLGIVNNLGEAVENNVIFSLLIKDILKKSPGSTIIYEVVVSKIVEDTIKKFGGIPVLSRVGHSYIHTLLTEKKAALAGENSAHYFFPENYGYDDAIFAGLKVAELLNSGSLSERVKEIPTYLTSEEYRPHCSDEKKFDVVAKIQEKMRSQGRNLVDIDGARVLFDNGWFIIRASNTGPQLVVRWEAKDQETFSMVSNLVKDSLAEFGISLE